MCLSIPAKVIAVDGRTAEVLSGGARYKVISMVDDIEPGDWVLIYAGIAIGTLDEIQASESVDMLSRMRGDEFSPPAAN